jgi:iron-sulfur cluster repair protein YtfE (RIC family)
MMPPLDTTDTIIDACASLNAIVARYPRTLPVMQRFGLDTCCGGSLPLGTAAAHHKIDLGQLLAALRAVSEKAAR